MIISNLENTIKQLGLTQNKLAVLSEVRPNTINDLVKGNSKRIEFETIDKILTTINQIASSKGIAKFFYIRDIIEYENETIPKPDFNSLINRETFELLKKSLGASPISTSIPGLTSINILNLLILLEEKLKSGIIYSPINTLYAEEQALWNIRSQLTTFSLADLNSASTHLELVLNEKGKEFIKLLKKYGTGLSIN
ncbi:helix-turn-helix domain-containing protein [Paenibacillus odorifer]|uniref:helix-turn-helix domain-containing protein n=1 Tax=Paenibacillus odorifer TaxID=189426 RepID=UPI00096CDF18|nr:helix-turn-helix transcriptional regulator [Paenibacillus odorifer]OMD09845.1 hypothetical protein BJP50_29370 [Paenibacillus odorifer]